MAFQLQILHASDFEGGVPAAGTSAQTSDAVRFSAVLNRLRTNTSGPFGVSATTLANTLTLSSGDNYIPGPFFNASSDRSLDNVGGLPATPTTPGTQPVIGRGDVGILNALGIQASALGNHEFDLGVRQVRDLLRTGVGNPGLAFPYLSTNLDFDAEVATRNSIEAADIATNRTTAEANTIRGKLAESTVITLPGVDGIAGNADDERIGIVGATTPTLRSISSPGAIGILPGNPEDFAALAAEIQANVDALTATGINKVILLSHMQQFSIEVGQLAPRLRNVDIIIAGGSHSVFAGPTNPTPLRDGDTAVSAYPTVVTSASGQPVLVVNTGANYRYVGRLVVDFDTNGVVQTNSINPNITGAYATDQRGLDTLFGQQNVDPAQTADARVVAITDSIRQVISTKDTTFFGQTNVFLDGTRTSVRQQETNLGNLTADANLAIARQSDSTVVISLKNGGGIRDNIGVVTAAPGATGPGQVQELPPQPNPLSPNKPVGSISQLDIENSLRFNNGLSLLTVTARELKDILEHGVSDTTATSTPGRFPQVGGLSFSFDATRTASQVTSTRVPTGIGNETRNQVTVTTPGDRIRSVVINDENGNPVDVVVADGQIVGDPNRTFRLVTLDFLAGGGDSYPLTDLIGANRVNLVNTNTPTGDATFAANGSEQDALAEYLLDNFPSTNPFNQVDVGRRQDTRIQNLGFRNDAVLGTPIAFRTDRANNLTGTAGGDFLRGASFNDFLSGREGRDVIQGRAGNDTIFGGRAVDFIYGGSGSDTLYGEQGNDQIFGDAGRDFLFGGEGDDLLDGGAGLDRLRGGAGNDQLRGGEGSDTFLIGANLGSDVILDLDVATDKIALEGGLAFGSLSITDQGSNALIRVTGNDAIIATVNGVQASALVASVFVAA